MQTILPQIIIAVYSLIAIFLLLNYLLLYSMPDIIFKFRQIFVLMLILSSSLLLGRKIIRFSKVTFNTLAENNIFSVALGLALYAYLTFFLGVLKLYNSLIFWLLLTAPLILLLGDFRLIISNTYHAVRSIENHRWKLIDLVILTGICLCMVIVYLSCFAPPTYYDSLVYHLALPQIYINEKAMVSLPLNLYSYFPQNMEMLYTLCLLVCDEIVPNLLTFSMFVFSVFLLYSYFVTFLPDRDSKTTGLLGVFLFVSAPFSMLLGGSSYVEAGLAFYSFLSFYSFCLFMKKNSVSYLVLSGIFCGISFGIKYTGITVLLCLIVLLFIRALREKEIVKNIRYMLILLLLAGLLYMPWGIKNILNSGNPVFPFFYKILGFGNVDWNTITAQGYFSQLTEYNNKSGILLGLLDFPWKVIESPLRYGGGIDVLGDFGWVVYFLIFPSIVFSVRVFQVKNAKDQGGERTGLPFPLSYMAAYIVFYSLAWFISKPVLRFLFPLSIMFSIICSYCIIQAKYSRANTLKYLLVFIVVSVTLSNIFVYFLVQDSVRPFSVALGLETKDSYLTNRINNSPYQVILYANHNLDSNDKIFFVGEQRSFYCDIKYTAPCVFIPNPLVKWSDNSSSAGELRAKLKNEGFTYILYNENEGKRLEGYGIFDFTEAGRKNWDKLRKSLKVAYSFNKVYLYSL